MNRLEIYIPNLEDYWYEQKLQNDPKTMSYNAGWNVSYDGYHYDTGCIDFPKEKWESTFEKRKDCNKFFAYLKDIEKDEFVGYINYHYNKNDDRYECGIVIENKYRGKGFAKEGLKLLCEEAKKNGVKSLYDNFEKNREGNKIFSDVGFKIVDKYICEKFNNDIEMIVVRKEL